MQESISKIEIKKPLTLTLSESKSLNNKKILYKITLRDSRIPSDSVRLKCAHLKLSYFDSIKAKNINQAFPPLKDINCVPKCVEKVPGPFLWVAREGHYEYTHYDPDEDCLMVIQGENEVRFSIIDHK